jgi:hypothetical protein
MPEVHVFLPHDAATHELATRQPLARRVDATRKTGVPGLEQRTAARLGFVGEQRDLPGGGRGRLFEHHVFAGAQREQRGVKVRLRRCADGDAVQFGHASQQGLDVRITSQSIDRRIAAGAGDELEVAIGGERRDVLVARDLADADQGDSQGHARSLAAAGARHPCQLPDVPVPECVSARS